MVDRTKLLMDFSDLFSSKPLPPPVQKVQQQSKKHARLAKWCMENICPIVYFHSEEKYPPIDFDRYICDAQLLRESDKTVFQPSGDDAYPLNAKKLGEWIEKYQDLKQGGYSLFLPDGMSSPCITRPNLDLDNCVPMYMNLYKDEDEDADAESETFYVNFAHLHAYNGGSTILDIGQHYADNEHVCFHIVVPESFFNNQCDGERTIRIKRVFFAAHYGGEWKYPFELDNERVIVYSALNTHASYPHFGNHYRFWGMANDKCDKGIRWNPQEVVYVHPDHPLWTIFHGDLGDGSVSSFQTSSWWNKPEETKNYGQGLCFKCS
jgi:Vacuolar protein sorting-associated protein 62